MFISEIKRVLLFYNIRPFIYLKLIFFHYLCKFCVRNKSNLNEADIFKIAINVSIHYSSNQTKSQYKLTPTVIKS